MLAVTEDLVDFFEAHTVRFGIEEVDGFSTSARPCLSAVRSDLHGSMRNKLMHA